MSSAWKRPLKSLFLSKGLLFNLQRFQCVPKLSLKLHFHYIETSKVYIWKQDGPSSTSRLINELKSRIIWSKIEMNRLVMNIKIVGKGSHSSAWCCLYVESWHLDFKSSFFKGFTTHPSADVMTRHLDWVRNLTLLKKVEDFYLFWSPNWFVVDVSLLNERTSLKINK